jgi:hypothetical protein
MKKLAVYRNFFLNLIFPALIFGSITGILTSIVVTLYKFIAKSIIDLSTQGYLYMREHLYILPIAIIVLILSVTCVIFVRSNKTFCFIVQYNFSVYIYKS